MPFITWTDSLSVQIAEIDAEHRKLVNLINELNEAMRERKAKEKLDGILGSLTSYTVTHFRTEERFFDRLAYPEATVHKNEHKVFVNKIMDFKKGFNEGKLALSMEVMQFLESWLIGHIKGSDKKYAPFFLSKGIR